MWTLNIFVVVVVRLQISQIIFFLTQSVNEREKKETMLGSFSQVPAPRFQTMMGTFSQVPAPRFQVIWSTDASLRVHLPNVPRSNRTRRKNKWSRREQRNPKRKNKWSRREQRKLKTTDPAENRKNNTPRGIRSYLHFYTTAFLPNPVEIALRILSSSQSRLIAVSTV